MRLLLTLVLSTCLLARPAAARTQEELAYQFDLIWNSAVRLVRVEMGLAIEEKDADAGFFLFSYTDHDKAYPGSVELVRQGGPRDPVSVVVHIGGMPHYVERMIIDKLSRKLEREYGSPKRPEPPPEKPAPPADEPEPPADEEPDGTPQ